ncbi:MAG TPA: hypothetical protein GX720_06305 [Clostridiaceae bacterium]|nr:hypothetical protein [Clostridiaceae bacterium]
MTKENIINGIKLTVGVLAALFLANLLKLEFQISAATVYVVAMLSTKKQSLKLSGTLLLAALFSLGLASILFFLLGFIWPALALYVLLFTYSMYRFDTRSAIITNMVLVLQLYTIETVAWAALFNQLLLMLIGLSLSFVINFFTIDIEAELLEYRRQAESLFRSIYRNMGKRLNNEAGADFAEDDLQDLDRLLTLARKRSYDYLHSFYLEDHDYYVEYFAMRRQQYERVAAMQKFTELKFLDQTEVRLLSSFTDRFADTSSTLTSSESNREHLEEIKHHFIYLAELPRTNIQLQNRVALHQYLYGLDHLVKLELDFINRYENRRRA